MVKALEAQAPGRVLRSLTSELCGPLQPGEASVLVDTLREGNAVTTCTVRLEQGGQVQAHGVGVLGKTRVTDRDGVSARNSKGPSPFRRQGAGDRRLDSPQGRRPDA